MQRDRNLLFGVLAVQLKRISPGQLVAAAALWAADSSKDLGARLIELGALSDTDRKFIDDVVERAVQDHHGDVAATLAAFGGDTTVYQTYQGSLVLTDGDGVQINRELPVADLLHFLDAGLVPGVQETPGRYSQVSEYGRGGMGRVLLVHDAFLGRDVALKELLPAPIPRDPANPSTPARRYMAFLSRFLQEARITGQLEHPSIVPVYELGHRRDGTLYYTMKLVRGKTLRLAIHECKTQQDRLELLPHFVNLCQAIAYAHSRRIIHRDLKPDNVMVGEFGETVVLDWGLAKAKDRDDVHADGLAETIRLLKLGDVDSAAKTQYGQVLGTPAYMPPEQAKGQLDLVDERSDVYSLGALLYEILSGRPPFSGASVTAILRDVIHGEPPPLTEKEVPAELIAICGKALRKAPSARYASAAALADEVRRFQSGAIVQTYRYRFREHLGRFVRRHKAAVTSVAVMTALLAVASIFSYTEVRRQRDEAVKARAAEALERRNAEFRAYQSSILLADNLAANGEFDQANGVLWSTPESLRGWEWGNRIRQCNLDAFTLRQHSESVIDVAFGANSHRLVTASLDGSLGMWDVQSGRLEHVLYPHDGARAKAHSINSDLPKFAVYAMDYSRDGRYIAALTLDGGPVVIDAESRAVVGHLGDMSTRAVQAVSFSPHGATVASVNLDGSIGIWKLPNLEMIHRLEGHNDFVGVLRYSHDGGFLISGDNSGHIRRWDMTTIAPDFDYADADGAIRAMDIDRAGERILACIGDNIVKILDARSAEVLHSFRPHDAVVYSARFSPDGRHFVTTSDDETIRIWGAADYSLPNWKPSAVLFGHSAPVLCAAFSPDGSLLATGSSDGLVKIWNFAQMPRPQPILIGRSDTTTRKIAVDRKYSRVFQVGTHGDLREYDLATGRPFQSMGGFGLNVWDVEYNGRQDAIYVAADNAIVVLDDTTRTITTIMTGHWQDVLATAMSDDENWLVSGARDGEIRKWNLQDNSSPRIVAANGISVTDVAIGPTGDSIAASYADGRVVLFDAALAVKTECKLGESRANDIEFTADGRRLVTASNDKLIRIWSVEDGRELSQFSGHGQSVNASKLSPDGARLASISTDGTTRLWHVDRAELVGILAGNVPGVDLVWNSEGNELIVAGSEGAIQVWTAAPWARAGLRENNAGSWQTAFAQYKTRQGAVAVPEATFDDDADQIVIVTTPTTFHRRFSYLLSQLRRTTSETSKDNSANRPLPLDDKAVAGAFNRFGLLQTDLLASLDGKPVTPETVEHVLSMVQGLSLERPHAVPFAVRREDRTINGRIVLHAPKVSERNVHMPTPLVLAALRTVLDVVDKHAAGATTMLRNTSIHWDVPPMEDDFDCIWVTGWQTTTPTEEALINMMRQFSVSCGFEYGDRLMKMNGRRLTSMNALAEGLREAEKALSEQGRYTFVFDVERGLLQSARITIHVA